MRLRPRNKNEWAIASSIATVLTAIATIIAVAVAAGALYATYWVFDRQTDIQTNQAAHTAVQEHMKVRVEKSEILETEDLLRDDQGKGDPDKLAMLHERDPDKSQLYITVAEHGIAMSEYVYKLWPEDPGWLDTVESWINLYRPYILSGIDCGDYDQDFIRFVANVVREENFCVDEDSSSGPWNIILLPIALLAIILLLIVFIRFRRAML